MTSAHYDDQFFNKNMVTMLGDGRRPYNGQKPQESVVIDGADSDVCVGDKSDSEGSAGEGRAADRVVVPSYASRGKMKSLTNPQSSPNGKQKPTQDTDEEMFLEKKRALTGTLSLKIAEYKVQELK